MNAAVSTVFAATGGNCSSSESGYNADGPQDLDCGASGLPHTGFDPMILAYVGVGLFLTGLVIVGIMLAVQKHSA